MFSCSNTLKESKEESRALHCSKVFCWSSPILRATSLLGFYRSLGVMHSLFFFDVLICFRLISAVWGKALWRISADLSPSYKKAIQGADKEAASAFKQKFLKSRRVGTSMFHGPRPYHVDLERKRQKSPNPPTEINPITYFNANSSSCICTVSYWLLLYLDSPKQIFLDPRTKSSRLHQFLWWQTTIHNSNALGTDSPNDSRYVIQFDLFFIHSVNRCSVGSEDTTFCDCSTCCDSVVQPFWSFSRQCVDWWSVFNSVSQTAIRT